MSDTARGDVASRFIFRGADVRGNIVRLKDSYQEISALHDYPPKVQALLGEFLVAVLLLSDTIKFRGRLTLQATSPGAIRTIMAEATHEGHTRGIVQCDAGNEDLLVDDARIDELLEGGVLAVTVEPEVGNRYQSLVPLAGATLAECLELYFEQSEQLSTFIRLASSQSLAAGMLIQQLPVQLEKDPDQRKERWQTIRVLAGTLTDKELLGDSAPVVLGHLFAEEEQVQLMADNPVRFACSCSRERMAAALVSIGTEDLASLFEETPELELTCEFCGVQYVFDAESLTRSATGGVPPH